MSRGVIATTGPQMLSLKCRSALLKLFGSHATTAWFPRHLLPTSCLVLFFFFSVLSLLMLMMVIPSPAAFWTAPVLGPFSLLAEFKIITVLLGAHVAVDFLVFLSKREKRTLGQWIVFPFTLIVVGLAFIWLTRIGMAAHSMSW